MEAATGSIPVDEGLGSSGDCQVGLVLAEGGRVDILRVLLLHKLLETRPVVFVDPHELILPSSKGQKLMVVGHRYPSKTLIVVLHVDGLVSVELGTIKPVQVHVRLGDHEGQEHVVVGDSDRINGILKFSMKGLEVHEFSSIEGINVNPLVVLG